MKQCPSCKHDFPDEVRFCRQCGCMLSAAPECPNGTALESEQADQAPEGLRGYPETSPATGTLAAPRFYWMAALGAFVASAITQPLEQYMLAYRWVSLQGVDKSIADIMSLAFGHGFLLRLAPGCIIFFCVILGLLSLKRISGFVSALLFSCIYVVLGIGIDWFVAMYSGAHLEADWRYFTYRAIIIVVNTAWFGAVRKGIGMRSWLMAVALIAGVDLSIRLVVGSLQYWMWQNELSLLFVSDKVLWVNAVGCELILALLLVGGAVLDRKLVRRG